MHLAQALVDARKLLVDHLERFADAALQRALQFFGNGLAHLLELGVVEAGDGRQALVQRLAQALLPRFHGQGSVGELLRRGRRRSRLVEQAHGLLLPLARGAGAFKHGLAQAFEHVRLLLQYALLHSLALAGLAPAQEQQGDEQRGQRCDGDEQRRQGGSLFEHRQHGVPPVWKYTYIIIAAMPAIVHARGKIPFFSCHGRKNGVY